MAVYHWIYGTATLRGDLGDLRIRMCGEGLRAYTDALTELSRRLLAMDYRAGRADRLCWFAGRLDRDLYLVAAGGGQSVLLGGERPLKGGFREQFSVFACGFDGPAEPRYQALINARDTALFEPLKAYTWELSNGQQPALWSGRRAKEQRLFRSFPKDQQCNIFPADPMRNAALWGTSALRPVALDLLSPLEARKLIDLLPDAAVTVSGEVQPAFYTPSGFVDPGLLAAKQAREAAQQVEEAVGKLERKTSGGPAEKSFGPDSGDAQTDVFLPQKPKEQFSMLERCRSTLTSWGARLASPKTSPPESARGLHQRWEEVERTAALYKAQLNERQLQIVERLLEDLYFENVRAICPIDLVRAWCWVRLWLSVRRGSPESVQRERLAQFIRQIIQKALYDRFDVEQLLEYCEDIIRAASKYKEKNGEA